MAGVPFAPGTEVDVTISPRRCPAEDFAATWRRVTAELRGLPRLEIVTDEDIRAEIDGYWAGQ